MILSNNITNNEASTPNIWIFSEDWLMMLNDDDDKKKKTKRNEYFHRFFVFLYIRKFVSSKIFLLYVCRVIICLFAHYFLCYFRWHSASVTRLFLFYVYRVCVCLQYNRNKSHCNWSFAKQRSLYRTDFICLFELMNNLHRNNSTF
jgi:hypothetical protein